MSSEETLQGGLDRKKYAAIFLALAIARGALHSAICGEPEGLQEVLELTSTMSIARALGCDEEDLAIIWDEHLSSEELKRIKGIA